MAKKKMPLSADQVFDIVVEEKVQKKGMEVKSLGADAMQILANNLSECRDIIFGKCLGYKPSERTTLMETITRLSLIARTQPNNLKIKKELNNCLDVYDTKFGFLHR